MSIEDVSVSYPHFIREDELFQSGHIKSWLGVPLLVRNEVCGMVSLDRKKLIPFSEAEIEIVLSFTSQAAVVFQNIKILKTSNKRADALELLHKIANLIISPSLVDDVLKEIVRGAVDLMHMNSSVIYLIEKNNNDEYSIIKSSKYPDEISLPEPELADEKKITRSVMDSGIFAYIEQVNEEESPKLYNEGIRSFIALPILQDSKCIGVLYVHDIESHVFSEDELSLLLNLVGHASIAINSARSLETERRRVEELRATKIQLERTINYLSDHRNLALIGLIYGETIHYAENKLGMAKANAASIFEGRHDNELDIIKLKSEKIFNFINEYMNILDETQRKAITSPEPIPANIHKLIDDVLETKKIGSLIRVEKIYAAKNPVTNCVDIQLTQVLFVVIDNAIKAIYASGGGILKITTEEISDNNLAFIKVSISDTGGGIPKSKEDQLFIIGDPRHSGPEKGFGIGLPWARSFLRTYGGNIAYNTEIDKGTTFYLIIPKDFTKSLIKI